MNLGEPVLIQETNHTVVWLRPYPVIAKVGTRRDSAAALRHEYEVASALAVSEAPVAAPRPGIGPLLDRKSGFVVTLPEATPVHEAASLQEDLRRACIEPTAWIVNQSLAATAVSDPVLVARASAEVRYIDEVATRHASRVAIVPLLAEALTGAAGVALLLGARAVAQT